MSWKIKAIAGPFVGQEINIDQNRIIGRDAAVDIVLQGGHISRRHAELSLREQELWIKDLNSSNGTLVNGVRISEQQLNNHDEIQIDVVRFLVISGLQESLREKTTESVSLTSEGLPSQIAIPKPAPMPTASVVNTSDESTATQAAAMQSIANRPVTPQASAVPPTVKATQTDNSSSTAPVRSGIKNTLPAAVAMALLILIIIISIWYFVG